MIIKRAVIGEKSMKQVKEGLFTFIVDKKARKKMIIRAIEEMFEVDVLGVKTANFKPVEKMQKLKRAYYTKPGFKKAVVRVKKGQKITLFEAESPEAEVKEEVKEKKSLLKGTKVKIERSKEKEKGEK